MFMAIISTYDHVQKAISTEGDRVVSPGEDPFVYNKLYGAYVEAWSVNNHLLTWAYLEGVVVAIYNALYLRAKYKTANFSIWDAGAGLVGMGNLREGDTILATI